MQSKLPQAVTKDDALAIALSAAELSMKALRLAKDLTTRKSLSAQVQSLLGEAERIKYSDDWTPPAISITAPEGDEIEEIDVSKLKKLKEPISSRTLTKAEEILLLKASKLNGFKFPPWKNAPKDSDFELKADEAPFLYVANSIHMYMLH